MDAISGFVLAPVGLTLILGSFLIFLLFWKYNKKYDCWKKMGVPYIKPYPILGSMLDIYGKLLHEVEVQRYKKYGSLYGHFVGAYTMLTVGDPEHLRNILVKDFHIFSNRRAFKTGDVIFESMLQMLQGEDWKRVRSIVSPTFTTGKIKRMMNIFTSCSKVLINNFRKYAEKGEPVDLKKIFGTFSMDVIANAAFSTQIDSHSDPNNEFVKMARSVFQRNAPIRILIYLLFPGFMKFFKIPVASQKSQKFFSDITRNIIEERKRTGETRNDFLQLLIEAADEQIKEEKDTEKTDDILKNYEAETNEAIFKNFKPKKTLSTTELVAQCVIFFLAGFETSASTLAFACYQLALNPDIQDKLVEELDDAIRSDNGELSYETIQNLKYLDNVISETMRLSPPSVRLERVAGEDYKLGDTGIVIPKDTVVSVPVYAIQRDPKYFPDPEKFDPERFSPEERAKRSPYTFMPFGAGPRNCVAMRFALVEVKVCLAYVLSHFKIRRCPETKVPLDFMKGQGLLQPKDVTVLLETRGTCLLKN